jgi:hypothetical protein
MRTRKTRTALWLILLLVVPGLAADLKVKGPYLGQKPPGLTPEVFAPGVISAGDSKEHSLSLSPKGDVLFFTRTSNWPYSKIMHMKRQGDQWSKPETASFLKDDWATQAVFSPDGRYWFSSVNGDICWRQAPAVLPDSNGSVVQ